MSEHIHRTIETIVEQVREAEQKTAQKKQMANSLCDLAGVPHIYSDEQMVSDSGGPLTSDAYYGKPLASVVREILERRKRAGLRAATVNEIYDAMCVGGYHFQTKNDDNAKRGLYISLSKNSTTFHKLPNGTYGLLEWYPNARPATATKVKVVDAVEGEQHVIESTDSEVLDEDLETVPSKPR